MNIIIEKTEDGSPTFYREDLNEHYHSVKGALTESQHVYVDCGWKHAAASTDRVRIFEVGFGTGLNAALTARAATDSKKPTEYFAIELYPLAKEATDQYANALPEDLRELFQSVNAAPWNQPVSITPHFTLTKLQANLLTIAPPQNAENQTSALPGDIDVIYFDAFAPEKQPEMWEEQVFQKLKQTMNPGAILTTYCAKGAIRRLLNHLGLQTERLPGPPAGKREILRATRPR